MDRDDRYIEIAGTVKAILFQNEENGYSVVKLETTDGDSLTAVGCLPCVNVGEQLIISGEFGQHASHGEQFKVQWAERYLPTGTDAIFDFLSSRAIKGVGPATATLLVTRFGEKTLEVIENEPEKLAEIRGISLKKAREISQVFKKQIIIRRLMEYLSNYGIKPVIAIRLYKIYGDEAMDQVQNNPYIITKEAVGSSFAEADRFALNLGFEGDAPERIAAAAVFELKHNTRNGHSFIPVETLISITSQLIEVSAESIEESIEMLVESGELVLSTVAGRQACYLASLYEAECFVAEKLKAMVSDKPKPPKNLDKLVEEIQNEQAVTYADLQRYSLRIAAENRVMVLTGGPGTGKTTTVRAIVSLFDKMGLETHLTAPTGRASKRMSELSGKDAVTVHRLLEAGFPLEGDELLFRKNENERLKCDAVILDECSMVDITLIRALLCALPDECRIVLVGDADQLPSIGPGNVFNDIIRSDIVPTVRLTEIFRQTAQSRIVANAHMINRGDYPELSANSNDSDFFFLRRGNPRQGIDTILELCTRRLPEKMGIPSYDIQVLSPTRRGEAGTRNVNSVLQAALNPPSKEKKEKIFGDNVFRQGDRVMQIRNNYDIIWNKPQKITFPENISGCPVPAITLDTKSESGTGIYNGDVGIVIDISFENEVMTVLFDDRLAYYGFDLLSELEHAYAITVHKSQGSEYRAVILLAIDGSPQLLSRKVLYTAVTRAKELLIIVGSDGTVYNMIDNHKVTRRFSGLRARLTECKV